MNKINKIFIAMVAVFFVNQTAFASDLMPSDFFQLDIYTGQTAVTGMFSEQKNPSTWGFSANIYFKSKKEVFHPSYISIGNYNFSMVSNDNSFPFPQNEPVNFSSSFLNLEIPFYGTDKFSLYFGVGYAIISLLNDRDKKYAQNYGSSQYELQARYDVTDKWSLYYKTKWQQINQYQNGNFSFIEMWSHLVGLGYLVF